MLLSSLSDPFDSLFVRPLPNQLKNVLLSSGDEISIVLELGINAVGQPTFS
jgi:hypothetical protein